MRRRVLRHPALRVALLFACFFSVVAVGQYLFARQKAYREMQHQLSADAARLAESIGSDWSKIAEFRQADFSIARWYVFTDSGQAIDVAGFISGLPSKVSPPVNLLSAGAETVRNEAGESFRVIGTRLGSVILLVGARVREGADLSDSRLRSQTNRFVQALSESKEADYVKASRKLDFDIDYAAVSDRGELLAAGGGIPLQAEPLEIAKFRAVGPRLIRQSTYFLATAVVRSTSGPARGFVLVPSQFDATSKALRDHAYFNGAIGAISWFVVVAAVAGLARGRRTPRVGDAIRRGEGEEIEFKGSLKLDERDGKSEDYLKTVAAFLNRYGGTLFVGVEDSGRVCGIALDLERFNGSRDQLVRFLSSKLGSAFGTDTMALVRIDFVEFEGLTVCRIDVDESPEPVFLQGKEKGQASLIVRAGSSSRFLDSREMSRYIRTRWKGRF